MGGARRGVGVGEHAASASQGCWQAMGACRAGAGAGAGAGVAGWDEKARILEAPPT